MNEILFSVKDLCYLNNGPYSFEIGEHDILGMTGESGIGKTQMLRALVEVILHDGEICLEDAPSTSFSAPQWRRKVALVPADSAWWYDTVALHFKGFDQILSQNMWLSRLGFPGDVMEWRVSRLSTGERQRLALIRALIHEPSVVLLDEPCSALDERSTKMVEEILVEYKKRKKTGIIWVSHDLDQLRRITSCCYQVTRSGLESLFTAHTQ